MHGVAVWMNNVTRPRPKKITVCQRRRSGFILSSGRETPAYSAYKDVLQGVHCLALVQVCWSIFFCFCVIA